MTRINDFTESDKKKIRRQSNNVCCICHKEPFVDIHHITPIVDGGDSSQDNGAPLCPNCHRKYGNNPDHRKQIKEHRDSWFAQCEAAQSTSSTRRIENERVSYTPVTDNMQSDWICHRCGSQAGMLIGDPSCSICDK